jgi:tetratricopeptide (TPR) repeat protein
MRHYLSEIVVCLGLAAFTLGALGAVCWNGFVNYDDNDYVVRTAPVRTGLSADNFVWALTTTHAANWHPVTWLSLQLDASLYGSDSAWGYHVTNLLLHTAAVIVLFLALRRMTAAVWRSAVVAALFAVHPAHVESVAWVAERKDVLSGLFWMLTLLAYAWYAERPGWRRYSPVALALALGLVAKPMLVTLPCVLLLLDYWPLNRVDGGRRTVDEKELSSRSTVYHAPSTLLLEKLPLFGLAAAACLVTLYSQRQGGAVSTLEQLPLRDRLMNCLAAYASYLGELVWPAALAPFYPHPRENVLLVQAVRAGLVLAAVTAFVIWARRRRYLTVGWLWFLGTLVPVIGLVQVGSQAMADRYTYLPYIGLFLALTWGVADLTVRWPARVRAASFGVALLLGIWGPLALWWITAAGAAMMEDRVIFVAPALLTVAALLAGTVAWLAGVRPPRVSPVVPLAALLLGVCVALSAWQSRLWHNSIWLWEYDVAVTRESATGHNNLGDAYFNSRHPERIERARENFLAALRLMPSHARAHNNLGLIFLEEGRLADAAVQFQAAAELEPRLAIAWLNWGAALARQGRFEEAIARLEEAARLDPGSAATVDHLGRAWAALEQWAKAETAFRRAVDLEPRKIGFRADLAWSLWHLGQREASATEYATVVAADETWPETARESAERLVANEIVARRNGTEAVRLAEQACQALGTDNPRFCCTLQAAYAERQREKPK